MFFGAFFDKCFDCVYLYTSLILYNAPSSFSFLRTVIINSQP